MMNSPSVAEAIEQAIQAQRACTNDGRAAVEALDALRSQLSVERAGRLAAELLGDSSPDRRILGARLTLELPMFRSPRAGRVLLDAMTAESNPDVLIHMIAGVDASMGARAVAALVDLVQHPDPGVRDVLAGAVSRCGWKDRNEEAVRSLILLAEDVDSEVRFSAIFEIGEWWQGGETDERFCKILMRSRFAEDVRIRHVVDESLGTDA